MIISDRHEFVFVHIPKCAGSSIRSQIVKCDPGCIQMGNVSTHPVLGQIDMGHIPLHLLRQHFPDRYDALRRYTSFAVMRDPLERFGSALRQTMWRWDKRHMAEMSAAEIRDRALRVIDELSARTDTPLLELVFFARQTDFIDDEGVRVVDHLLPMEQVPDFIGYLSKRTGTPLQTGARANQNIDLRVKSLTGPAHRVNAVLRKYLPADLHSRIKNGALSLLASRKNPASESGLLDLSEVRDFVADYYARDIALHQKVLDQAPELKVALAAGAVDPAPFHGNARA